MNTYHSFDALDDISVTFMPEEHGASWEPTLPETFVIHLNEKEGMVSFALSRAAFAALADVAQAAMTEAAMGDFQNGSHVWADVPHDDHAISVQKIEKENVSHA